jgi:hypothetical protein
MHIEGESPLLRKGHTVWVSVAAVLMEHTVFIHA